MNNEKISYFHYFLITQDEMNYWKLQSNVAFGQIAANGR